MLPLQLALAATTRAHHNLKQQAIPGEFHMSQQSLEKTPANSDGSTARLENQPDADVKYATVYTFVIYDHDKGTTVIYPRMATRQTIANMRGKVNEETAWVVDVAELDVMGFYVGEKSPDRL